jgi:hypothetical protein
MRVMGKFFDRVVDPLTERADNLVQMANVGNSDPLLEQTSSLRLIEANWNLGSMDGTTLLPGQPLGSFSFDQLVGLPRNW